MRAPATSQKLRKVIFFRSPSKAASEEISSGTTMQSTGMASATPSSTNPVFLPTARPPFSPFLWNSAHMPRPILPKVSANAV